MTSPLAIARFAVLLSSSVLAAAAANPDLVTAPCGPGLNLNSQQVSRQLASKNAERAQHLHSFVSERHYALDYTGLPFSRSAEMSVGASYLAPGTKQFTVSSESGSKLILTRVLHRLLESEQESSADESNRTAVALTSDNYRFALRGCDTAAGRDLYVMDVEPLRETKFLYRGTIWIDALDFAVVRIEAEPAKNPSFWIKGSQIHHQYQKIGEFYLPFSNETITEVRLGGRSVLKIRYENYKIDSFAEIRDGKSAQN
jgi:hypothetical protein